MSTNYRHSVISTIYSTKLIPLFYTSSAYLATKVADACYAGGARVLEFTCRGPQALDVFKSLAEHVHTHCKGMVLGIGSIIDAHTAAIYLQYGADFIVSPLYSEDIARLCNKHKVLWIPGCGSLTEISRAEEMGAELVKLFPGNVFGPEFIKAALGPSPKSRIMPTGGVKLDKDNIKSWLNAGACCLGIGSDLITKEILIGGDVTKLEKNTRMLIDLIRSVS